MNLIAANMETNKIYCGDSLEVLRAFPDESVDCCITSPPIGDFGIMVLRDNSA